MSAYDPPWIWLTKRWPDDAARVWVKRIGGIEPPFLATTDYATATFTVVEGQPQTAIPFWMILKWRAQTA
jgi:hypothetical protein